jgi:hypothetical protein
MLPHLGGVPSPYGGYDTYLYMHPIGAAAYAHPAAIRAAACCCPSPIGAETYGHPAAVTAIRSVHGSSPLSHGVPTYDGRHDAAVGQGSWYGGCAPPPPPPPQRAPARVASSPYGALPATVSEEIAYDAVMRELKITERMSKPALKVEPGMLVAEFLIFVATHLINALSVGGTQRIHLALKYIFAKENAFFQSVGACEQLVWIGSHDGASALALRLACQKVAVAVYDAIPDGHAAAALLRDVCNGELINSSITVLDVARAISAEGDNGAVLARTDVLRERLRKPMDPKSDLHTQPSC